jgi:hypothetical protein
MRRPITDFARNLVAGTRLALLLPVSRWQFRPDLWQLTLLFLLSAALNPAYDLYLMWPDAEFNFTGLYYQAMLYLLFFASVILMAAAGRELNAALPLGVMVLAVAPASVFAYNAVVLAVEKFVPVVPPEFYVWLTPVYLIWYLVVVLRAIRMVLEPRAIMGAVLLATFAAFNIVPWYFLPPEPLWTGAFPDTEEARRSPDVERLFFRQDELLAQGVKGLLDHRPGVMDVYFIGVAGDAGEDVFMNEVQRAGQIFSRDFDASGRTLLLVNNRSTFDRLPLASQDNLQAALQGVARKMDPEEDILLLFLTSHGEEGQGLTLDLDEFRLAGITPRWLRAALDGAGIRYRAVIVSACFSGEFIDELRNTDSLVMTSARRDRSSFGCGHDGPYTYFGAAFFGTELPKDLSLVAAFERARASLGAREAREQLTPSEPQLWVGSEIAPLLEQLTARLRARGLPPLAAPENPAEVSLLSAPVPARCRRRPDSGC